MADIRECLRTHRFERLFIEDLGWDRASGEREIEVDGQSFKFIVIAQKRGFAVLECLTHRTVLAHRGLLRKLQRQLTRFYHEHLVVYACEEPRKQVWQWAVHLPDSRKVRHREHPFFSNDPPIPFLERLAKLGFSLEDEETATLSDAIDRVRIALDTLAEKNLFSSRPSFARRSDELAVAVQQGVPGAFDEFVLFHQKLAHRSAEMLVRWVGMEKEDAEQTAMIGLIEAARRFDPARGYQFSTYASYWLRQRCQRSGVDTGLPIRIPTHAFWPCYRLRFEHERLLATWGPEKARERFGDLLEKESISEEQWRGFQLAYSFVRFSDLSPDDWHQIRSIRSKNVEPDNEATIHELQSKVHLALSCLSARRAQVLKLRHGIGTRKHTLQEVGEILGVTRERARQIQKNAEKRLKNKLLLVFSEIKKRNTFQRKQ